MKAGEVRQVFLDFFASKGHHIAQPSSLIVQGDPTLLFTNAGMNPFKDLFLGNRTPDFRRVADTQPCLRVSGKHNDLEDVGKDTYHHTLFEMLGNWSFGDYFKEEAIAWAWELLTGPYGLSKDRLYVTYFEGDATEGLEADHQAKNFWKQWIAEDRILPGNKKDNFWEMGDTGPCGPCSEIHVDCRSDEERKKIPGEQLVNKDHPQVIEIWNNVFIQYNRKKDGSLEPLPSTHVDTGMGLERLVRVLQGKTSNYDTDIFSGTIQQVEVITGKKYDSSDTREAVAFRVLADHIRAISFTIADGQLPSNTGAGYVIRRILRRAVRYYYSYLGYKQPLLAQLVPLLANQFENVFPELQQQVDFVTRVVREEEEAFLRTLEKGLRRIEELISASAGTIAGAAAFELYDTYGFPIDLTRLIASEKGLTVDEKGFEDEMKKQKDRSRAATAVDAADWVVVQEGANQFVGYDSLETNTNVLKYRKVTAKGKEAYQWILEKTPFYAESGGQVGDKGWLKFADESIEVIDTKKDNDLIVHVTAAMPATVSATVTASVNPDNRLETTLHHSATHLLHAALRQVLGAHVAQKGSMVHAANLRFDFSHFAKMSEEEILQVEAIVNEKIRANIPVVIQSMSKDEALKLGAMALFGEKYGDVVRVVIMDPTYSVELCGGTHVGATGQLGYFKITGETAVAAGVRRVEACCGKQAEVYLQEQFQLLDSIKQTLKNPKELLRAIEQLQSDNTELKKQLEVLETRQLRELSKTLVQEIETVNGISFLGKQIAVDNPEALKKVCTELKVLHADHVAVLTALIQEKPFVAVSVSNSIVQSKGLDAGNIIKEKIAPLIKGGGGGQKTLATAGGQLVDQLPAVIAAVKSLL